MGKMLVTAEEATDILSMGRTRIYQLINSGDPKLLKCGKSRRIVAESIRVLCGRRNNCFEAWLAAQERNARR
jgi:hypothetical protein